jgi:hypothetical protein
MSHRPTLADLVAHRAATSGQMSHRKVRFPRLLRRAHVSLDVANAALSVAAGPHLCRREPGRPPRSTRTDRRPAAQHGAGRGRKCARRATPGADRVHPSDGDARTTGGGTGSVGRNLPTPALPLYHLASACSLEPPSGALHHAATSAATPDLPDPGVARKRRRSSSTGLRTAIGLARPAARCPIGSTRPTGGRRVAAGSG